MKRALTITLVLLVSLPLIWMVANAASPWPEGPPPKTPTPTEKSETVLDVEDAIYEKIDRVRLDTIYFWNQRVSVEDTQVSRDGQWAASLLVPSNLQEGLPPETEPVLVISMQVDGEWQVWMPNTPGWLEMLQKVPDDLLSPKHKEVYRQMNMMAAVNVPASALGGYLLPWDKDVSYYLTGSTCHDEYIESGNGHYAFDFAYNRTMWDILAAKSGEVWVWQDSVPTCYEPSCWRDQPVGNYIVLRDTSTTPTTYQLYLHLKADSIPDEIKVRGYPIQQGEFIGIVDNTGQSSGSHLHFQVQVPYLGEDHYWGRSVDITFDDVAINGGRPRIHNPSYCLDFNFCTRPDDVCDVSQLYYTSQNQRVLPIDSVPPEGDLLTPLTGETHTESLHLEAWARDLGDEGEPPSGLTNIQFMAFYEGNWHDIGPSIVPTSTLWMGSLDWDWCADEVPDGPVSVALRLKDYRGNQTPGPPGLRHVTKKYNCEPPTDPPACQPSSNEVAIFSEINYRGDCYTLETGDYPNSSYLGFVGENDTASILVGSAVQTELFSQASYAGRTETLQADDPNLGENKIGSDTLSSLKVITATTGMVVNASPQDERLLINKDSLTAPTDGVTAPYSDTLEGDTSGWMISDLEPGWWHLSEVQARSGSQSFHYGIEATGNYDDNARNSGSLTSPPITLTVTTTSTYVLQFWYRYETESHYTHWDQRWVQVKIDDGPFTNAYQLSNDPMGGWLKARIDLLPYYDMGEEHTLQVRFFFDTVDKRNNDFEGWYIDDFQVAAEEVIPCPEDKHEPNDGPESATDLSYGQTKNAAICTGWDQDYYVFTGKAGDRVVVDIDAKSEGSDLDGYLFLLDSDGSSVLAENDDEVLYEKQDPVLGYVLPRDGQYYLKLRAWDHPNGEGIYSIKLSTDDQDPAINLSYPTEDSFLPQGEITFTVQASDAQSGIHYVQFLYHTSDWELGDWIELGKDYEGADGWNALLDTSTLSDGERIAVYVRAYDRAGNWAYASAWNVTVDTEPPDVELIPLNSPSDSTAVHLQWTVTDTVSGYDSADLEQQINSGSWQNLLTATQQTEYWWVGEAGNDYAFRVQAQDQVGNQARSQKTSTSIPSVATLCSNPDEWDVSDSNNDNTYQRATTITLKDVAQAHNFCNPAVVDRLNDQDWLKFNAQQGEKYILIVKPTGESTAVNIRLYAANGTTLLASSEVTTFGHATFLNWTASQTGTVYIQLQHNNGRVAGNGVSYTVRIFDNIIYLPTLSK